MRALLASLPVLMLLSAAACSKEEVPPPPPRTPAQQRTVDSTIGASAIPGATSVQKALVVQDSAAARKAQMDSIEKNP